ncbi:MAG: ribonuclease P protein subunit [archaeon]|nr:ribonuclease P protein subunit [archaeon]
MITSTNLVRHELIGLEMVVNQSKDKRFTGISGSIVDETKSMMIIESNSRRIRLVKKDMIFDITIPTGDVVRVCGKILAGRPEERIKKKFSKKWKVI